MNWKWRAMRAIVLKDLGQVRQNRMVWLPMVLVPAIIQVLLPLFLILLPALLGQAEFQMEDVNPLVESMPSALRAQLEGASPVESWVVVSANQMFAPMFLIVPLMVSSILAADSFVGEKERKTLEGLLYTPVRDAELYVAKVLVGLIPALVVSLASFVIYGVVANLAGYHIVHRIFFPQPTWWPLVFWLGPGVSAAGLGVTVLISSKAKTFMQAQQVAGVLVLPIVFLMIAQLSGLLFFGVGVILLAGAIVWAIGLWLIWIGAKTFRRGELITRV